MPRARPDSTPQTVAVPSNHPGILGKLGAELMAQWFLDLHPAWQALIRVLLFVLPVLLLVPGLIWWERRLLSWMQDPGFA